MGEIEMKREILEIRRPRLRVQTQGAATFYQERKNKTGEIQRLQVQSPEAATFYQNGDFFFYRFDLRFTGEGGLLG